MKQGKVYIKDVLCGIISESEEGYCFAYDKAYLNMEGERPLHRLLFNPVSRRMLPKSA